MSVMTREGREAAESQLSPNVPKEMVPGAIVHCCTTDPIILNNTLGRPCVLVTVWGYPTSRGGVPVISPGATAPRLAPYSPEIYRRHPTNVKGGVPGGPLEPGETVHLPAECKWGVPA
jgi:hypothetical protein